MTHRSVKIRDALKTEYADFISFCVSLDKQFIFELTTSDFIAFRTQHNATRDYVARIQQLFDSYSSHTEASSEDTQDQSPVAKPSAVDTTEKRNSPSKEPTSERAEPKEPKIASEETMPAKEGHSDKSGILAANEPHTLKPISKKRFASDKGWFMHSDELRSLNVELPLYDLFGIPRDPVFTIRDVAELELSVRPYHCLMNNRCRTFDALFNKTLREISFFTNLGQKSLFEIIGKCKEIAANPQAVSENDSSAAEALSMPAVEASERLLAIAESVALGIEYEISDLSDAERRFVSFLDNAYQMLGEALCLMALETPEKARELCSALGSYVDRQEAIKQVRLMIRQLSRHGISSELHVLPFVAAMKKKMAIDLRTVFTDDDRFADMVTAIEKCIDSEPLNQRPLMDSLLLFADEVSKGISKHLARAYKNTITTDRIPVLVKLRQQGHTLAEVGDLLGITRERVRQIENKSIRTFSKSLKYAGKDIVAFIHALLDGDLMIHKEEIAACVPDSNQLHLLWACIAAGAFDCNSYYYDKQHDAVVFKHENMGAAERIAASLPRHIFRDELEEIIRQAVEEEGVWEEKIRADIKQRYKVYGLLYSERRPTVPFICDWILKNRFTNGYKVNHRTDARRFTAYIREVFGEERSRITQRALDAKVSISGMLCDRGKYIHPSAVTIDQSIIDEVYQYIADSPKQAITYIELFDAFRDKLADTPISNHYFLQGVMKQYGRNANKQIHYHICRDYITKDERISPTDELDAFVRERGIVHKSEIYAEFPALNDVALGQVVARCPDVYNIDSGNYIHASRFHIQEADYAPIRAYLTEATRELPVTIRKVFDDCSVRFPAFMDRNALNNCGLLYAALSSMFGDAFRFTRPYIANSDDIELTNRGIILGIMERYEEIAVDELMDALDERGIRYSALPNLLRLIAPDYMRVDKNLLMKRELTGIDDDVAEEAQNILSETVEICGYLPSCKVLDFIWYPSLDVAWTPYLLESIVLSGDKIDYVPASYRRSDRSLVVYVSKEYAHCDFQSLILRVVDEEYEKGTFASKSDMREWLIDAGFIDVKLPNYLESSQYYYTGDDGRLVKREDVVQ